jgi:hypothetical protein
MPLKGADFDLWIFISDTIRTRLTTRHHESIVTPTNPIFFGEKRNP